MVSDPETVNQAINIDEKDDDGGYRRPGTGEHKMSLVCMYVCCSAPWPLAPEILSLIEIDNAGWEGRWL